MHTASVLVGKETVDISVCFRYRYIDDVLSFNNSEFVNYLDEVGPVECVIEDTDSLTLGDREGRSILQFHLWQMRINITMLSWAAIFHLHQPMAFSSHSWYNMPHIDVLFLGQHEFPISVSNVTIRQGNMKAWNHHWGSFIVDAGIWPNNMKSPLTKAKWHSEARYYTVSKRKWKCTVSWARVLSV